jgi:hypothetical protein
VSISTGTNWFCNLLISSTFLSLSDPAVLTIPGSFGLYAIISAVGVLWLFVALPETKGLSLEEMELAFHPQLRTARDKDNDASRSPIQFHEFPRYSIIA